MALTSHHNRKAFTCGEPSLDDYLKKRASQQRKQNIAQVFVMVHPHEPTQIRGYYTLSSYALVLSDLPEGIAKKLPRYPYVGATLLGRLAVDVRFKGQGLGSALLWHALEQACDASQEVASWAVVVDALHDDAKRFYLHYGFTPTSTEAMKLFLPMKTIAALLR